MNVDLRTPRQKRAEAFGACLGAITLWILKLVSIAVMLIIVVKVLKHMGAF